MHNPSGNTSGSRLTSTNCGSVAGPSHHVDRPTRRELAHTATNDAAVSALHRRYLRRVGEEAGAIGNMMFEVINEALAPSVESYRPETLMRARPDGVE